LGCRFRRDSRGYSTQENDFDIAQEMESCLKKLVLEARRQAFRTRKRAVGSSGTIWEKILCSEGSTGGRRVYTCNRRRAKKLIPAKGKFWLRVQTFLHRSPEVDSTFHSMERSSRSVRSNGVLGSVTAFACSPAILLLRPARVNDFETP